MPTSDRDAKLRNPAALLIERPGRLVASLSKLSERFPDLREVLLEALQLCWRLIVHAFSLARGFAQNCPATGQQWKAAA
jgi:hypothetical protein